MFSVILRRSPSTVQKVLPWAGPWLRCGPSALTGPSDGAARSLQTCWVCTNRPVLEKNNEQVQAPGTFGFGRIDPTRRTLNHVIPLSLRNQHFHSSAVRLKKRPKSEPPPRELDLLRYDMKHLWDGPKPALYLGFAGLIPFVVPTLFMGVTESYYPELAYAQLAYGASIISFLGGARWGFALPESSPAKLDWFNLGNSVVPSLFAWGAMLMSDSIIPAVFLVVMGLGVSLHYDLGLLPTYPSWLKALRSVLTVVAFFSLVGTLLMNGSFPEKKIFLE